MENSFSDFLTDLEIQNVTTGPPLALERFKLGQNGWMHHMILAGGTFVDLLCRTDLSAEETQGWMYLPPDMTSLPGLSPIILKAGHRCPSVRPK